MSSQLWPRPSFHFSQLLHHYKLCQIVQSDWAASSKPLLLLRIGRLTPNVLHCEESACQIHLLNHQGHTHIITAWWLGRGMKLGTFGWTSTVGLAQSRSSLGKAPRGLQTPKKLAGGFSWAGGGWGTSSQNAAHGCGRSSQHRLVLPKIDSGSPKRGASSMIHESLFLHYLILGRLLGLYISLVAGMNSIELEGLLTIIPGFTGSHSQSKLFVFIKVSGWTIMLQLGTTTTAFVCDMPSIYQHISS